MTNWYKLVKKKVLTDIRPLDIIENKLKKALTETKISEINFREPM